MMRALVVVLAASLALTGCASVLPVLVDVIAAVTDGVQILDAIETFVRRYFVEHPNDAQEREVAQAIAKARAALNVTLRASQGAKDLDEQKVEVAFQEFRIAYQELLTLVRPLGVHPAGSLRAVPNGLEVPDPIALKRSH